MHQLILISVSNFIVQFHKTPLHYAIERGNVDFIESLITALQQVKSYMISFKDFFLNRKKGLKFLK